MGKGRRRAWQLEQAGPGCRVVVTVRSPTYPITEIGASLVCVHESGRAEVETDDGEIRIYHPLNVRIDQ